MDGVYVVAGVVQVRTCVAFGPGRNERCDGVQAAQMYPRRLRHADGKEMKTAGWIHVSDRSLPVDDREKRLKNRWGATSLCLNVRRTIQSSSIARSCIGGTGDSGFVDECDLLGAWRTQGSGGAACDRARISEDFLSTNTIRTVRADLVTPAIPAILACENTCCNSRLARIRRHRFDWWFQAVEKTSEYEEDQDQDHIVKEAVEFPGASERGGGMSGKRNNSQERQEAAHPSCLDVCNHVLQCDRRLPWNFCPCYRPALSVGDYTNESPSPAIPLSQPGTLLAGGSCYLQQATRWCLLMIG
jgi:hypothetical protein